MTRWTEKQLEQIAHLWDQNMRCARKIDRRKVHDKDVQRWAVSTGMALWKCQHGRIYDDTGVPPWSHVRLECPTAESGNRKTLRAVECRWTLRFKELGDGFQSHYRRFREEHELPVEILWMYVKKFVYHDGTTSPRGYSINKHRGWHSLNIYEQGSRYDPDDKHAEARWTVLNRLAMAGYITLQAAGTIWQITVTERGKGLDDW